MRIKRHSLLAVSVVLGGTIGATAVLAPPNGPAARQYGLVDSYRILRTPAELPRNALDRRILEQGSSDGTIGRVLETQLAPGNPSALWIVATDHQLCLAQKRGAACAPRWVADREGVLVGTFRSPTRL